MRLYAAVLVSKKKQLDSKCVINAHIAALHNSLMTRDLESRLKALGCSIPRTLGTGLGLSKSRGFLDEASTVTARGCRQT